MNAPRMKPADNDLLGGLLDDLRDKPPPQRAPVQPPAPVQPRRTTRDVTAHYQRGRAAAAFAALLLVAAAIWLLNGNFTARAVVRLFDMTLAQGWITHIGLSVVELALIFCRRYLYDISPVVIGLLAALVLPLGVFDVWSSATALLPTAARLIESPTLAATVATVGAQFIAFAPEPLMVALIIGLRRALQE